MTVLETKNRVLVRYNKYTIQLKDIKEDLQGIMMLCETEINLELLNQLEKLQEAYIDIVSKLMKLKKVNVIEVK